MEPTVSILMTVFNREKYLSQAIESVINQEYTDWELIIVDDGSTDRSVEIAQSYSSKNDQISFYQNEANLGDYPNRNRAASLAKGKYLKYVDADDLLYPHGLKVMVHSIEKFPEAAIALCRSDDDLIPMPYCLDSRTSFEEHFFKKNLFTNSPLGVIMKRQVFNDLGGFSGKRFVGDYEMWMKIALYHPVVKMVPGLAFWRSHGDQEVVKGKKEYHYPPMMDELIHDILNHKDLPFNKDERKSAWIRYRKGIAKGIVKKLVRGSISDANNLRKAHKLSLMEVIKLGS
ncbi:MAG: glycosyltransferase family A protein [Vicingaceae bacterium]